MAKAPEKYTWNGSISPYLRVLLIAALLLIAMRSYAGGVTLAWEPVASPVVAGYMLYYGPSVRNYTSKVDVGKTTSRTISNLTGGTTYHFAVTAYDASHTETSFSNDVVATVPFGAPVAGFTASATSGTAPLAMNFINSSTGTIGSYAWTFGDGTSSSARDPAHVYSAPGAYTVSLTVAGPGGSNTKTISSYVKVTAPAIDSAPPSAPASLVATAGGSTSVGLRWNASTDDKGVTGYRIERCQGAGCTAFVQIATSITTTFSNTGLVAGTRYAYRVRATDAAGRLGAYSNTATATTFSSSAAKTATTTTLTTTPNPSLVGAMVTLTATVTGNTPTGTLKFTDKGIAVPGCATIVLAGTGNSRKGSCATTGLVAGMHILAASYTGDGSNLASTSTSVTQVVNAPGAAINVALAANGGVATASSTYAGTGYLPASVIDNKRSGTGWGHGGGWIDATASAFPDWLQVRFNGVKTIDRVVVYSVQDNFQSPVEPTATMTFALYGLTDFLVQGFNGTSWVTLATVSGNRLVKRTVTFAPYTTDRLRIYVTRGSGNHSRMTELEAWTSSASTASVNLALAANGGVATASSTYAGTGYLPASVIDNKRSGTGWGHGGGWIDATASAFPDWLQVRFNGVKTIDRVVVYSVQDNFQSPVEPTATMTFALYGLTDFLVQGFNGTSWVTLATVSGNRLVKRTVTFAPYKTDRLRIYVTRGSDNHSRMTELEAWGS